MKRLLSIGATATVLALMITGCAGSTPEDEKPQDSDGATSLSIAVRKGDNNVVPLVVDLWNETHPDIPASVTTLDGNADQQRQQFSLELDAGSDEFDVIGVDVTWTGEFAKNGWIANIDSLRATAEDEIYPGPVASGMYQDELYAMPLLVGVGLLYYRTDLIDTPATTWDELTTQGNAAAASAGIAPMAGQGAAYEGMVVNYLEYLWGAGGDLFNDDYTEATLTDGDAAMTALQFMKDSYDSGFYVAGFNTMTEAEAKPAFEAGEVALMRHWVAPYIPMTNSADSAVVGKFDIAPLPTFTGTGTASALGGLNLAVNANSSKQDAATDFIEWATTDPDAQALLATNGIGPASTAAYDSPEVQGQRFFETLAQILPDARPRPPLPEWADISSVMQQEIFAAYTGQKDMQAALDTIQTKLEEVAAKQAK